MALLTLIIDKLILNKKEYFYLLISLMFLIMVVKSTKYVPYFVIYNTLLVFSYSNFLVENKEKYENNFRHFLQEKKLNKLFFILFVGILIVGYFNPNPTFGTESFSMHYPSNDLMGKINNYKNKKIFAEYGWGGYLIRYSPQNKTFIDGRMPSWKQDGVYAFKDYLSITRCENSNKLLDDYKVDIVMLNLNMLNNKDCKLVEMLKGQSWKEEFNDNKSVILIRK